jgi:hypothetical protein
VSDHKNKDEKRDTASQDVVRPPRKPFRIGGMVFDRNGVWVSEFSSIIFICILLASLLYITRTILRNESAIHELDEKITVLKTEKVSMTHELETLREKQRVLLLMREVAGRRIRPDVIDRLANIVYTNSKQFGYSPELLLAVMAVESRFTPRALGRFRSGALSGALGLMQVKYETALFTARMLGIRGLTEEDLLDPEINTVIGTAFLTMMIGQFQSFELGIMAYNLGPGTVRGTLARREQLPTGYYQRVLTQYYRLKELGDRLEAEAMLANTRQDNEN